MKQFCPESNDLLYPVEDRERRRLVFKCQSCNYQEDAPPSEWCVYRCVFILCAASVCAAIINRAGIQRLWPDHGQTQPLIRR